MGPVCNHAYWTAHGPSLALWAGCTSADTLWPLSSLSNPSQWAAWHLQGEGTWHSSAAMLSNHEMLSILRARRFATDIMTRPSAGVAESLAAWNLHPCSTPIWLSIVPSHSTRCRICRLGSLQQLRLWQLSPYSVYQLCFFSMVSSLQTRCLAAGILQLQRLSASFLHP